MKGLCIAIAAVIAALLAAGAVLLFTGGVSARAEPSAAETWIARTARRLAIPASAKVARNPEPPGAAAVAAGRAHFADHCATCHGNDGRGKTELGRRIYPRAPDLTAPATQGLTDGELFWIIENGIRFTGMPGWGHAGAAKESWQLVRFIRHLPELSPEEVIEMERLNPRSSAEAKELEEEDRFLETDRPAPRARHK